MTMDDATIIVTTLLVWFIGTLVVVGIAVAYAAIRDEFRR